MRISVIQSSELESTHIDRWRDIQQGNPEFASPYFCPEFTLLTGSVRQDVRIGMIEDGNEIMGFFPFQKISGSSAGPVGGPLSDYHGLILAEGYEIDARQLLRQCGLKSWEFNHQIASQRSFQPYHEIEDFSFVINLSNGIDSYLRERRDSGSKLVQSINRKRRKLEREIGPITFQYHSADVTDLSRMFEWKSRQYIATGNTDVFGFDWPRNLLSSILAIQTETFAGVLSTLHAGDELVAVHMGMRSSEVWHWWFPTYNQCFSKYSPGSILLLEMVGFIPQTEMKTIDLGKGYARYKEQFSNNKVDLAEGKVSLYPFSRILKTLGQRSANVIRKTPLVVAARLPARIIRRYSRWKKFR